MCRKVGPGSSSLPVVPSLVPGGVKSHWGFQWLHRIQVDLLSIDRPPPRKAVEYVLKGRAVSPR